MVRVVLRKGVLETYIFRESSYRTEGIQGLDHLLQAND